MQVKNETLADYLVDLPWIFIREVQSLALMGITPSRLVAIPQLVRRLPAAIRKRRAISLRRALKQRRELVRYKTRLP
jgi:hypothetical protein